MKKEHVKAVFDRKNQLKKLNQGKIELRIYLSAGVYKFIHYGKCTAAEWKKIEKSAELKREKKKYEAIISAMISLNEELTLDNLDRHLGIKKVERKPKPTKEELEMNEQMALQAKLASKTSFLDFFEETYKTQKYRKSSIKRKRVMTHALTAFNKIKRFEDLTPKNIMAFDRWLDDGTRMRTTIGNYHKQLHMYILKALHLGYIQKDPYPLCDIKKGRNAQRHPLSEEELIKIAKCDVDGYDEIARDLFIFSAYTGLAYCDVAAFRYKTMTDVYKDQAFIDGRRVKTGSEFYTPILPKAMQILKKYRYKLPKCTNQCCNEHLKNIAKLCKITKKLTFHVARHSFATLCLNHDIPLEEVAKMLGHKNIKTTQIYAKVLHETVLRHTNNLISQLVN